MRICLDLRFKTESGASSYIRNLVPHLLRLDRSNTYVGIKYREQSFPFEDQLERVVICPGRTDVAHMLWTLAVLPWVLLRLRVDLYHGLKMPGPLWNPVRTVGTIHSEIRNKNAKFPHNLGSVLHGHLYAGPMMGLCDQWIAVSKFVADAVGGAYKVDRSRISIVPNAADERFQVLPEAGTLGAVKRFGIERSYLLGVGNVFPVKNQLTSVRAFARIAKKHPVDLVFAGALVHGYAEKVGHEIAELGLQDRVRFLGFVEPADLVVLMNGAKALLLPSLTEGCPITLIEALACGLPSLTSACGGLPEVGGTAALYVTDPMDDAGFANQIERILSDPALARDLAGRGIERAKSFSWEMTAKGHLDVYYRTLGLPRPSYVGDAPSPRALA